ncbi:thioesterase [Amylibacter ulvae]|uniref:Thioesterase n=1 Tax=Paramylibacter ulvae TaxID=1651968 RepID=A0ABQ3D5W9_9RHOB|nr:PaaI family thioesterase [Amylibacter ulvae]GHA60502.1 thioesterase [Amylibacter ulvae]
MFFAKSPEELPSFEELLARSGLEFMTDMLNGVLSGPPIAELLNFRLHAVEKGSVTFAGAPKFDASNPMGTVHGGWYGTVLDSAMACSVMTMLPQGSIYTTAEFKVNIIRGIALDQDVLIKGVVDHCGRTTGVATAQIVGRDDGKLYATGSTTCVIMRPK